VSTRSIKENFVGLEQVDYPSNLIWRWWTDVREHSLIVRMDLY
jgi:hypothetical protein